MLKWIGRIFRNPRRADTDPQGQLAKPTRELTKAEQEVLSLVQQAWGPQNTVENVFFMDQPGCEGAWIFAMAPDGTRQRGLNLTNISAWYRDGTYSHEDVVGAIGGPSTIRGTAETSNPVA